MPESFKKFPIPEGQVALFDLDGTLIGYDYKVTDNGIYSAVQEAQEAGWQLGLSSDTPFEALTIWRKRLGFNGPIIAEKGAITVANKKLFFDRTEAAIFAKSRSQICERWQEMGARIWYGNPVEALRKDQVTGQAGEIITLVHILRRNSIGFHIRQVQEDGNLAINRTLTERLRAEAEPFYPPFEDLHEDLNHDYGLIILSREATTKRSGTQRLASVLQVARFAMVGNSAADFLGEDLAFHYAVGDATEAFKQRADYISPYPQTSGVVDILGRMTEGS